MSSRIRKYESGYQKRKKKKITDEIIQSQKGALDKFFNKESQASLNDQHVDVDISLDDNDVNASNENPVFANSQTDLNEDHVDVDVDIDVDMDAITNVDDVYVDGNASNENPNPSNFVGTEDDVDIDGGDHIIPDNIGTQNIGSVDDDAFNNVDIFDPINWDALDSKMIDVLAVKGPKRDMSIEKGPKDKLSKRFSSAWYTRNLSNGEKCDRDWLVYSKELDKVFCFCCKFFRKRHGGGALTTDGYKDWSHLSTRLKEHETCSEHLTNMKIWYDLRLRLQTNQTIDKVAHEQIEKEKSHWKKVLVRIVSAVKFLAKYNIAFRGTNEKLYDKSNGNFLGLIEMLAEFDPCIQEHVKRITNDEIHFHYLGNKIQNELITLLAKSIKSEIIKKVKEAKYFSVILDCTPDISHQEQMSLILRYVDVSSKNATIEESFLGFLEVNDTTGQGLFDAVKSELECLGLDIDNVRGQSYDNGSNMKGKHKGVQKIFLDINPRAFHTSCASHSLNLTLCDIGNTCGKARDFFGIIQRIYTIFAFSTKRWQVFKENVKGWTVKSLSTTRWESRINSVKSIRFQVLEIREALLQVAEIDNDSKIRSEAKSLAHNELGDFEFLVSMVVWYDILSVVNEVSKKLQAKSMLIDVAIEQVKGLISYFKGYRHVGLSKALESAKKIAIELDVEPSFRRRREIRRKRHFDENPRDGSEITSKSPEEAFEFHYFDLVVDHAISSLETRFEQYQEYEKVFGFLFSSKKLCSLTDACLLLCCNNFENALRKQDRSDVDANDLYVELKLLQDFLPDKEMGPIDILKYLKRIDCFPNAVIAYRIMLTIPVTVASAERSFSKLKLLKNYLRSTMTQDRLNNLALISIENEFLEQVDHEELVADFVSKNVKRILLFK